MRQILLAYAIISLVVFAALSVLSYGQGAGYVYLYWREWQVQTNVWVLFISLALLSLFAQLIWYALRRYLSREQRKREMLFDFKNLHPYEQLAVIWLLDAGRDQQAFIQNAFQQSVLLNSVIDAKLASMQGLSQKALSSLDYTHAMAFELAELQRIEIHLAENEPEKALTHLEFLNQHALSPWLEDVSLAYQKRLTALWGKFALQFPWLYLRATQYGHLVEENKEQWLGQLLQQFDQASAEDLMYLSQRYFDLLPDIENKTQSVKLLWLKVLARLPDMKVQQQKLAEHLLTLQFHEEVFYLWFQQQLLQEQPNFTDIEEHIIEWEKKYPSIPVLSFAKYYVYKETGREDLADELLVMYPEHVLMSYLRVQSALKEQPELSRQLNIIFENNANNIIMKI
jgi:hypothetical protein